MDFMDISKMRITTRQFDPRSVEKEKIDKILNYLYIQKEQLGYEIERLERLLRAMKGEAK